MKKWFSTVALVTATLVVQAQEVIKYEFVDDNGRSRTVEAVVRQPTGQPNGQALLILHHAGGWGAGTTAQYGEYFSQRGFVTLEPRLFNTRPKRPVEYLGEVFGGLKHLAQIPGVRPDMVSVMGLSFGAHLTLMAATEWANSKYTGGSLKFKAHAPFYPVCWGFAAHIKRQMPQRMKMPNFPDDAMDKWVGVPMRLFTGTLDDYDDRDPKVCPDFIETLPDARQKALTSLIQYEGATHGWDQRTASFYEHVACKGRGCTNNNVNNPQVTSQAMEDLLKFLLQ